MTKEDIVRRNRTLAIALTVALGATGVSAQQAGTPTNRRSIEFMGTTYDIDYSQERTQVLIRPAGAPGGPNLVGFLKSDLLQDVLQTSLLTTRTVNVTHYDQNIIRAVLLDTPTTCSEEGCVREVDCAEFACTAVIAGESRRVRVDDRRVLGVLLTAINGKRRVEYLAVDQNGTVTRVKVNVPEPPQRR